MIDYFLHVLLEIALKQPISLIQHKKLALIQQIIVLLHQIFESTRRANNKMYVPLLNLDIVLLDHGAANEKLDIDLGELRYFLS